MVNPVNRWRPGRHDTAKVDPADECQSCTIEANSCPEWCDGTEATTPSINVDVVQVGTPSGCRGGSQTVTANETVSGQGCVYIATLDAFSSTGIRVNVLQDGGVTVVIEDLFDNALFSAPAGSIAFGSCDDFDVTLTRTGGSGSVGACFGVGSTIRVYT